MEALESVPRTAINARDGPRKQRENKQSTGGRREVRSPPRYRTLKMDVKVGPQPGRGMAHPILHTEYGYSVFLV